MRITRRMRRQYLKILIRVMLTVLCILLGAAVSAIYINKKNAVTIEESRFNLCVVNRDVEAGEILEEKDVDVHSIVNESKKVESVSLNDCIGKRVKMTLKKDTILSSALLCLNDSTVDNQRKLCYSFVHNTEYLQKGDYIDVRISFPNGADFTILSKKEVMSTTEGEELEGCLWLGVTEEEILRMSSGVVDAYLFDGAYIYADLYLNVMQKETIVNYPVNEVVEDLIEKNPNIIQIAQDRKTLELRKRIYEDASIERRGEEKAEEDGLIYFE